jgi:hypothetical protein
VPDARVIQLLASSDARCPGCDYQLRALGTDICPECGRIITVRDIESQIEYDRWRRGRMPPDRLYTVGLIGSIMGFPFALGAMFSLGSAWNAAPTSALPITLNILFLLVFAWQVSLVRLHLSCADRILALARARRVWICSAACIVAPALMVALALAGLALSAMG